MKEAMANMLDAMLRWPPERNRVISTQITPKSITMANRLTRVLPPHHTEKKSFKDAKVLEKSH